MFESFNDVLTFEETCKALRMGRNMLYKLLRNGTIKSVKIGRKYYVPKISLNEFINSNCN